MKMKEFLYLCFIILMFNNIEFGTSLQCSHQNESIFQSNESLLADELLNCYNTEVRPFNDSNNNKITILVGMTLQQIISVKEKEQEFKISTYMTFNWTDSRFHWNPKNFEKIETLRLPVSSVWSPRIILDNNKDGSFDVSLRSNVLVRFTGMVQWIPPALYTSSCKIEVYLFPFDWQNCSMVFKSATYDRSELDFAFLAGNQVIIDTEAYQKNGEWELLQIPAEIDFSPKDPLYEHVTFFFIIRRRPQFYIINLIIPFLLITSLSCFVFYLPSISCEKMTLSISVLLGQTVFLFLIAQRMPETSISVPLIAAYLLFCMSLVIISVICSVIVCNIHFRSSTTHKMPQWVVYFFMEKLAPFLNMERPGVEEATESEVVHGRSSSISARRAWRERSTRRAPSEMMFDHQAAKLGFRKRHIKDTFELLEVNPEILQSEDNPFKIPIIQSLPKSLKSTQASINYIVKQIKFEDKRSQSQDDWAYVGLIMDKALMWIYLALFTLGTLGFYLQIATVDYPKKTVING